MISTNSSGPALTDSKLAEHKAPSDGKSGTSSTSSSTIPHVPNLLEQLKSLQEGLQDTSQMYASENTKRFKLEQELQLKHAEYKTQTLKWTVEKDMMQMKIQDLEHVVGQHQKTADGELKKIDQDHHLGNRQLEKEKRDLQKALKDEKWAHRQTKEALKADFEVWKNDWLKEMEGNQQPNGAKYDVKAELTNTTEKTSDKIQDQPQANALPQNAHMDDCDNQPVRLFHEKGEQQRLIESLEQELQNITKEKDTEYLTLKKKHDFALQRIEALRDVEKKSALIEQDYAVANSDLVRIRSENQSAHKRLEETTCRFDEIDAQRKKHVQQLEQKVEAMEQELKACTTSLHEAESQVTTSKYDKTGTVDATTQLDSLFAETAAGLSRTTGGIESEKTTMAQLKASHEQQCQNLQDEIKQLTEKLAEPRKEVKGLEALLESETHKLKTKLAGVTGLLRDKEEELSRRENEMQRITTAHAEEVKKLNADLIKTKTRLSSARDDLIVARHEKQQKTDEVIQEHNTMLEKGVQLTALENKLQLAEEKLAIVDTELHQAVKTILCLEILLYDTTWVLLLWIDAYFKSTPIKDSDVSAKEDKAVATNKRKRTDQIERRYTHCYRMLLRLRRMVDLFRSANLHVPGFDASESLTSLQHSSTTEYQLKIQQFDGSTDSRVVTIGGIPREAAEETSGMANRHDFAKLATELDKTKDDKLQGMIDWGIGVEEGLAVEVQRRGIAIITRKGV